MIIIEISIKLLISIYSEPVTTMTADASSAGFSDTPAYGGHLAQAMNSHTYETEPPRGFLPQQILW